MQWTPFTVLPEEGQTILVKHKSTNAPMTLLACFVWKSYLNLNTSYMIGWMDAKEIIDSPLGYDPTFGDDKLCICGHTYYRHFDTYENMSLVGCKYCWSNCIEFKWNGENLKG